MRTMQPRRSLSGGHVVKKAQATPTQIAGARLTSMALIESAELLACTTRFELDMDCLGGTRIAEKAESSRKNYRNVNEAE
jgi:hypothetical protein